MSKKNKLTAMELSEIISISPREYSFSKPKWYQKLNFFKYRRYKKELAVLEERTRVCKENTMADLSAFAKKYDLVVTVFSLGLYREGFLINDMSFFLDHLRKKYKMDPVMLVGRFRYLISFYWSYDDYGIEPYLSRVQYSDKEPHHRTAKAYLPIFTDIDNWYSSVVSSREASVLNSLRILYMNRIEKAAMWLYMGYVPGDDDYPIIVHLPSYVSIYVPHMRNVIKHFNGPDFYEHYYELERKLTNVKC